MPPRRSKNPGKDSCKDNLRASPIDKETHIEIESQA